MDSYLAPALIGHDFLGAPLGLRLGLRADARSTRARLDDFPSASGIGHDMATIRFRHRWSPLWTWIPYRRFERPRGRTYSIRSRPGLPIQAACCDTDAREG